MLSVSFKSAQVERANGRIVIAVFDGSPPACVVVMRGTPEAARELHRAIGSALETPDAAR